MKDSIKLHRYVNVIAEANMGAKHICERKGSPDPAQMCSLVRASIVHNTQYTGVEVASDRGLEILIR